MANPTARTKALALRARPLPPKSADPLDDPEVRRLEERFLELRTQLYRNAVETAAEMGELLRRARPHLSGHYHRWLGRMGLSGETAANYERLAALADAAPRILVQWKELGATKLYRIARMTPEGRRRLLSRARPDDLIALNDRDFAERTRGFIERRRKVTSSMRAHGFRMKMRAWSAAVKTFADVCGGVEDAQLCRDLRGEIERLARELRALAARL
ncbi:MAG: hypothetical protein AABZ30_11745 [Myxococcota bacterium]